MVCRDFVEKKKQFLHTFVQSIFFRSLADVDHTHKNSVATLVDLAWVVRKVQINHYLADRVVCFVNTYPLDSDLSE